MKKIVFCASFFVCFAALSMQEGKGVFKQVCPTLNNNLIVAAQNGNIYGDEGVLCLLGRGANVNYALPDGFCALRQACQNKNLRIVQLLLLMGADPNVQINDGGTCLLLTTELGHVEIAKKLLAAGANPNLKYPNGVTALVLASQNGRREMVSDLLQAGADVNATTMSEDRIITSPLRQAVQNGHVNIVAQLLAFGAQVEISSIDFLIGFASVRGYTEIEELLKQHAASQSDNTHENS